MPSVSPTATPRFRKEPTGVDDCWCVIPIVALLTFLSLGALEAVGYLYIEFVEEFNVDRETASWPISLMVALGCSVGLILPPLHRKFSVTSVMVASSVLASVGIMASGLAPNIAWISVTLGVIHGFGAGTTYMSGNLLMMMYFDKLRGVALGFTSVGLTLAGLVFPRLLSALKDAYGFSGSLFIWGALIMNLIPLTCSLKVPPWHSPTKHGHSSAPSNSLVASNDINRSHKYGTDRCGNSDSPRSTHPSFWKSLKDVTRNPVFYVLLLSTAIFYAVEYVIFTTIVDYAVDNGTDESTALWLTPWYLLTCSVGRVCLPLLADKRLLPRNVLLTLCLLLMATSLLVLPYAVDFWMIVVVCTCIAACYGSNHVMHDVLLVDYFGVERLVVLYGIVGVTKAPLLLLTPSLIGIFRDTQGSYDNLYRLEGGLLMFAGTMWLLIVCWEQNTSRSFTLRSR